MKRLALLIALAALLARPAPAPSPAEQPAPAITARWSGAGRARITISAPGCLSNGRVWLGCTASAGALELPPAGPHDAATVPQAGDIYCLTVASGARACDALRAVVGLPIVWR